MQPAESAAAAAASAEAAAQPPGDVSPRLARSAGKIGIAIMASRLLGLARDAVLAGLFGAGNAMDAYNVAFRIPNLLRDLFAEGAMSSAFVPTFTRHLTTRGKEDAWRLGNNVINALLLVTGIVVLLGIVFAGPLTTLIAAEYAEVPGKLDLTIGLTRIMLPFLTLVALAAVFMGMLNALNSFFIPALSPAMFNVATILCAFLMVPTLERIGIEPIFAIAIGTLLGGLGQIAMQWPLLQRHGFRYRPGLDLSDPGLREVLILMGPGTVGLAATQVNLFVSTILATGQGTGAVSWLTYAFRIMYVPIGLFGVSVATAAVPDIARHAARGDLASMRRTVSSGLRLMLMLSVPSSVGLIVLASPIVALLLERGEFTPLDTAGTASALMFYAPGLLGYSAVKIGVSSFYALRDSRTPVLVSFASVVSNIVLNLVFVRLLGFRGLALGTAMAAVLNAGMMLVLLRQQLGGLDGRRLGVAALKITVASAVMGIAAGGTAGWLQLVWPGSTLFLKLMRVAAAIAVALLVLTLSARLLRIEEFGQAIAQITRRFTRQRSPDLR